jgi:hypothetical protein
VSVRWCLVVNTFLQAFLEVLHHSLQHGGRNCCHFFPDVLFLIHHCPWFLFVHRALKISSEEEVLWLGTLVLINIEVPTKYPLNQDRIVVFEIRLHNKSLMLYRPALHGNWTALSLAKRALKNKFPTPTVPLTTVLQNCQVFLSDRVLYCTVLMVELKFYYTWAEVNFHPYNNLKSPATCVCQALNHDLLNVQCVASHHTDYVVVASRWKGRGSNPSGGKIFRTSPDWPWGPPSPLYNGYRVFPGGKERPACDADPSPPSSAVGHVRVELYLYFPYGP